MKLVLPLCVEIRQSEVAWVRRCVLSAFIAEPIEDDTPRDCDVGERVSVHQRAVVPVGSRQVVEVQLLVFQGCRG